MTRSVDRLLLCLRAPRVGGALAVGHREEPHPRRDGPAAHHRRASPACSSRCTRSSSRRSSSSSTRARSSSSSSSSSCCSARAPATPRDGRGRVARALRRARSSALARSARWPLVVARRGPHAADARAPTRRLRRRSRPSGACSSPTALVPFELSSALLMVAVVGAVAVARGQPARPTALTRGEPPRPTRRRQPAPGAHARRPQPRDPAPPTRRRRTSMIPVEHYVVLCARSSSPSAASASSSAATSSSADEHRAHAQRGEPRARRLQPRSRTDEPRTARCSPSSSSPPRPPRSRWASRSCSRSYRLQAHRPVRRSRPPEELRHRS